MRTFDLTPFHRHTVGFDRLFSALDQLSGGDAGGATYPPYNIEKTGDNQYRISIAVAGFAESDLTIVVKDAMLTVRGERKDAKDENCPEVLFQGIAARAFERRFQLADYVTVTGANLLNGLLHIDLMREVPEAKKPRIIAIGQSGERSRKAIEGLAEAA
jgi:molecular chaperone IbpA